MMTYFKIAWRNFKRYKLLSGLNIFGLAIGMAACLIILQYVSHELSFDQFYGHADKIYRVNTLWKNPENQARYATSPPPLADAIRRDIPEVEAVCRVYKWSDFTMRPDHDHERIFRENNVYAVDADFFKVFDYGLLRGDRESLLTQPASIVLPKSAAIKYFGQTAFDNQQIVGRKIKGGKDAGTPWLVTGVMEDQPQNAHFQFEFLISSSSYPDDLHRSDNWSWPFMHTYLRLQDAVGDPEVVQDKLKQIVKQYALPFLNVDAANYKSRGNELAYPLQALTDIHLTSNYLREMRPNGNRNYVQIFIVVAIFILLIASINYINLFTAQSSRRAKEVGIKKVIGASKNQLIQQFLAESFIACSIATILALALVEFFRNATHLFLSGHLSVPFIDFGELLFWALLLLIVIALLAGSYPAFYMTRQTSIDALTGKTRLGLKHAGLRNSLITFQFVISIGLIASTVIVNQQVDLFHNKALGFQKENVLVIENDREIEEQAKAFKTTLLQHPQIKKVSFSNGLPGLSAYKMREFNLEGHSIKKGMNWYQMDVDHLATLNMELASGRMFSPDLPSDSSGILLNEAAAKLLALDQPIGQYLIKNEGAEDEERLQILGVIKDFHFESLHHAVKPLAIQFFKGFVFKDYISVRIGGQDLASTIAHVATSWKSFEPEIPLRYSFLDKDYEALFQSEIQLVSVFALFSGLAIIIACLGLFGLAAFITEQRTKEIGIRKVLGASAYQIVSLLSREFLKLVMVAALIASPLVWYLMNQWLQNFHYRISILWWIFALATGLALLIACLTISYQSLRAAYSNPIHALRNE
ncbi:MAG: ABC transporter permease [Bacteroidota bacterium]